MDSWPSILHRLVAVSKEWEAQWGLLSSIVRPLPPSSSQDSLESLSSPSHPHTLKLDTAQKGERREEGQGAQEAAEEGVERPSWVHRLLSPSSARAALTRPSVSSSPPPSPSASGPSSESTFQELLREKFPAPLAAPPTSALPSPSFDFSSDEDVGEEQEEEAEEEEGEAWGGGWQYTPVGEGSIEATEGRRRLRKEQKRRGRREGAASAASGLCDSVIEISSPALVHKMRSEGQAHGVEK